MSNIKKHIVKYILAYLTAMWVSGFLASLFIVNSYVGAQTASGKYIVAPGDRWECLTPLFKLYTPYLVGILTFWFTKPFQKRPNKWSAILANLALIFTLSFTFAVLYLVSQKHLNPSSSTNVIEDVRLAVKVALALSPLVAPINAYYFGMKGSLENTE